MFVDLYYMCAVTVPIALEGLPISSSGHVLLCAAIISRFYGSLPGLPTDLDHIVHLPIALIVALFFAPRWLYLLTHINRLWYYLFKIIYLGFITVGTTGCVYVALKYSGVEWFPLWLGYSITTALLFSLRYCAQQHEQDLVLTKSMSQWNMYSALLLGAVQGLALLPGISRLGITYVTARWLGMRAQKAFELSFLIEWPISFAGFLLGAYSMHRVGTLSSITPMYWLLMLAASVVGLVGLWVMQQLVDTERVWLLGWYTAFVAVIALLA